MLLTLLAAFLLVEVSISDSFLTLVCFLNSFSSLADSTRLLLAASMAPLRASLAVADSFSLGDEVKTLSGSVNKGVDNRSCIVGMEPVLWASADKMLIKTDSKHKVHVNIK